MKVYCFEPSTSYSGGCYIVVANSPEEALGAIHCNKDCFLANYTDINHCKELTELAPVDINEPKVILDTMYVE